MIKCPKQKLVDYHCQCSPTAVEAMTLPGNEVQRDDNPVTPTCLFTFKMASSSQQPNLQTGRDHHRQTLTKYLASAKEQSVNGFNR